ncbi:Unknown protein [Striga hermonthica]|uniref:Cytochrome P450 n=1 Tax=Striga hermonthica TaxID=68872 RepID=A0A9N7NGI2_STRHE|nr:Unknown protein [Striga hermonthica]
MLRDPLLKSNAVTTSGTLRSAKARSCFLNSSAAAAELWTTMVLMEPSLSQRTGPWGARQRCMDWCGRSPNWRRLPRMGMPLGPGGVLPAGLGRRKSIPRRRTAKRENKKEIKIAPINSALFHGLIPQVPVQSPQLCPIPRVNTSNPRTVAQSRSKLRPIPRVYTPNPRHLARVWCRYPRHLARVFCRYPRHLARVFCRYLRHPARVWCRSIANSARLFASSILLRCVDGLVDRIKSVVGRSEGLIIELNWFLFFTVFNTVGNILLSEEVMRTKLDEAREFFEAFMNFVEWLGKPNVTDCFPFLRWLDPQGIRRNTASIWKAGTETTGTTIEWGMAELLRHPSSMKKIQEEIDRVVGRTRRVQEDDLAQMPYLQGTVEEILRLHLSLLMLLPRKSMEDTELMGGQQFHLIPFGSGRRSCVGVNLGHRMVGLTVASLLQVFDWKLAGDLESEELDMREMVGLTLRKKVPLKVIHCVRG